MNLTDLDISRLTLANKLNFKDPNKNMALFNLKYLLHMEKY